MSEIQNFNNYPQPSAAETFAGAPLIGDQEVLGLDAIEKGRYGLLFRNIVNFTPQSIAYSLLPENNQAQERYTPEENITSKKRTEIIKHFRRISDIPEEFTDSNFIQHLQGFADAGYITEEYRPETVMRIKDRDVVYVEETPYGGDYARPAAYLAQLFELRFGVPIISIMTESVVSETSSAEDADAHTSMLLLHLNATKQGLHPLELRRLTDTEIPTVTSRLRQLTELGLVQRFKSAYWKNSENPFPEPKRHRMAPSKVALIRDAIEKLPDHELITPDRILEVLLHKSHDLTVEDELPDEEYIVKELSQLGKHGHLTKAAPSTHSMYQLTELGHEMTEALLVPLVKIVKRQQDITIPDGQGNNISLRNEAIPRLQAAQSVAVPQLLEQYRAYGRTPEAREERTMVGVRNALRVFDTVEGAIAAGLIRKQAQVLPLDWSRVVTRMLHDGYIETSGRAVRGRELMYEITSRGRKFLEEAT